VVDPGDPVEFAVPKVLVPGVVAAFWALPAPLGSLTELLRPPTFAGPLGTPLTAALPAPGAPALGDPTALPLPTLGPLAAPAAEVLPPDAPPADPPPLVCPSASVPVSDNAAANAITIFMWHPLLISKTTTRANPSFQKNSRERRSWNSFVAMGAHGRATVLRPIKAIAERVRRRRIGCQEGRLA
jgi:hypothetical protein